MVTMQEGIREVRDSGSRFVHRLEAGMLAAFALVSGPPMTEQERTQHKLAETESIRRYSPPPV